VTPYELSLVLLILWTLICALLFYLAIKRKLGSLVYFIFSIYYVIPIVYVLERISEIPFRNVEEVSLLSATLSLIMAASILVLGKEIEGGDNVPADNYSSE
jgi:hypothetical protein